MKKCLLSVLIAACSHVASTQSIVHRIDSLFKQPGYLNGGILIAGRNGLIYHEVFGYSDFSTKRIIGMNDGFQSASVSKVFTSTAILQLAEKGRLKLSDRIKQHFPSFPYEQVSIRHLLNHTSGIPDVEVYDSLIAQQADKVIRNSDLLPALSTSRFPLRFTPGSQFQYCNTGYQLLALLVEKVSGLDFGSYLNRNIFKPAGMKNSRLREGLSPVPVTNNTIWPGYSLEPQNVDSIRISGTHPYLKRLYYDNYTLGATFGDQNVIITTGDLYLFTKAFLDAKLIGRSWVDLALTPLVLNDGTAYTEDNFMLGGKGSSYGLGWELHQANQNLKIGHSGYNRGIYVHYVVNVTNRQVVILYDNTEGPSFGTKLLNAVNILDQKPLQPIDLRKSAVRYFANALLHGNSTEAILQLIAMKRDTANFHFSPQSMNQVGYDFLRTGYIDQALETFKINLLFYPDDYNRYDSYGDALLAAGRKDEAILSFQKALSLNPGANDTSKKLRALENK